MNLYTLIFLCIITAVLLACIEYKACSCSTAVIIRCLPLLYGLIWIILGLCCYAFDWFAADWISFSGVVGFALIVYGALSMVAVLAGSLVYRCTKKKAD